MPRTAQSALGRYRVDYHVIQVVYFDSERILTGPDFGKVWSGLSVLGKDAAIGAFWHSGGDIPERLPKFELGSMDLVNQLLAKGKQPIYGGGTVSKPNV